MANIVKHKYKYRYNLLLKIICVALLSFQNFVIKSQNKALQIGGINSNSNNNNNNPYEGSLDQVYELNHSLNLNTNGVIYDMDYDKENEVYIIAGNFTSVGGIARNNLAVINKDLTLNNDPKFSILNSIGFNGPVNSVVFYKIPNTGNIIYPFPYKVFFGGEFTQISINGNVINKNYLGVLNQNFFSGNLQLSGWNPDPDSKVSDIIVNNDTLLVVGEFNGINTSSNFILSEYIVAFNAVNNTLINNYPLIASTGGTHIWNDIEVVNSQIYLSGNNGVKPMNANGSIDNNFQSTYYQHAPCCVSAATKKIKRLNDSMIVASHFSWLANTIDILNINENYHPPAGNTSSFNRAAETYKDKYIYVYSDYALRCWRITDTTRRWTNYQIKTIWTPSGFNDVRDNNSDPDKHIFRIENRLFISVKGEIDDNYTGLKIYCLEPMDVETFQVFNSTVCAGQDSVLYVVNKVDYATEYKWEYSGTGMLVYQDNGLQPLDTLTPTSSHLASDSIYVKFDANFTPGLLTVTAMSECGVPSKPYSASIASNPLPQITTIPDTTLNCLRDTIVLQGSSSTPNVTYTWHPNTLNAVSGTTDTINNIGEYVFEVKDVIGCSSFDTVKVTLDTVSPIASPIPLPHYIDCANPTRNLLGSSNNPNDSIYWSFNNQYYSNPILASVPTANYRLIVLNKINGCADSSQAIVLGNNSTPPNIEIQGYPNYTQTSFIDTLTCVNDTLNFTVISNTPNAVTNWTSADSTQLLGNQIEITETSTYYILATDTSNGCKTFKTVLVDVDTVKPIPLIFPNQNSTLNCSYDSISIIGGSPSGNTNSYWTGPNGYTSSNPAVITTPGIYTVNVTSINNGCMSYDSTEIIYSPTINVDIGNDSTVCNQQAITFETTIEGINGGLNYLWNNGSTDSLSSYVSGVDSLVIVEVFGNNNCYGTDTAYINIPPYPDVQIASFKPCGADSDGQIVVLPISGWTPFQYSIDNGINFNTSGVFNNLTFGNYSLTVLDSLNCTYNFSASITDTSNLPSPMFLVQTYNFSSDTVILVDVSVPPTDSNQWFFPANIQLIDSSNIAPVIVLPDTGSYPVTMRGFYGSCSVDLTKTIYAIDYDTTYANATNANGIKSMLIYPNPNSGNFTVEVEFYKKQQAIITIQDISGNNYFYNQYGEVDNITENITLNNVINGTYILKIISEFDSRYITFIITQ